jgi:DNA mismatch repair protein PMS1
MPVRRQFYNTNKKKKEELKKMEDLIVAFSVILPKVRFTLTHDKEKVVQKNGVPDCRTALLGIMGKNVLSNLVYKSVELEDPKVIFHVFDLARDVSPGWRDIVISFLAASATALTISSFCD